VSRILVVDDEPAIGWTLRELLGDEGHRVAVAASVEEALDACRSFAPEAILLDVRLPGRDGLSAMPDIRGLLPAAAVIVMTAFGDLDTAVRAVQAGARDYLVKPFDLDRVAAAVARVLADRAVAPPPGPPEDAVAGGGVQLVGATPAMQEVFQRIALFAATDLPVLVTGAPGTGKELAARAIHAHSARRERPFVAASLAALDPAGIERELFGAAVPGGGRSGLVALAEGGTLFLEAIDEAPPEVQARLARLLEQPEDAGSPAPGRPARVIAASECDLRAPLAEGRFRGDLFQSLTAFTIALPPLADRLDDLEPLARHFLARHLAHAAAGAAAGLSEDFIAALRRRPWPGNVRELKHAIEYAAVVSRGGLMRPEHLPQAPPVEPGDLAQAAAALGETVKRWSAAARGALGELPLPDLHRRAVEVVEATLLRETLAHTGGNRSAAARLLGLDRATLRTKLRLHRIDD